MRKEDLRGLRGALYSEGAGCCAVKAAGMVVSPGWWCCAAVEEREEGAATRSSVLASSSFANLLVVLRISGLVVSLNVVLRPRLGLCGSAPAVDVDATDGATMSCCSEKASRK